MRMATQVKPPRSWEVDDLLDLGEKEGVRYLKAIPVLMLEQWVQGGRKEGEANYVRTKALARRLVGSGLVPPFKPKGTSNILGAIGAIQASRNLTRPPLVEYKGSGMSWVNLLDYEPLLQEYRREYRKRCPEDYEKLFRDGEPQWESLSPATGPGEAKPTSAVFEPAEEIQRLLAPVQQALRERQQTIAELTESNQKLHAELARLQAVLQDRREVVHHRIVDKELSDDCARHLDKQETFIDAIRRAGVVLEERLKDTVGDDGPGKFKEGVELVDYALMPNTGKLMISDHPAEQDGVRMLFRGAVQFVRNPPAHKKVQYTELQAWQTVGLIDYLLLLLQQARRRET